MFKGILKNKISFLYGLRKKKYSDAREAGLRRLKGFLFLCGDLIKNIAKKVDERKRILKSDVRLIKLPRDEIKILLKEYIKDIGWNIFKEEDGPDAIRIISQNHVQSSLRLFISREPQIAKWYISEEKDYSRIRIRFSLFDDFAHSFNHLLGFWLGLLLCILWVMQYFHRDDFPFTPEFYRFFLIFIISSFVVMQLVLTWITDSKNYFNFKEKFYSKMYEFCGKREVIISQGWGFPALCEIFFILFLAIVFLGIFIVKDVAPVSSLFTKAIWLLGIIGLVCYFILGLILFRGDKRSMLRLSLMGLITGMVGSFYSFIPVVNVLFFDGAEKLNRAVPFIVNNFQITRNGDSGLLMSQAQTVFLSFSFISGFMCLIFWGALISILNAVPELIKSRHWYNMSHPESEFSLSNSKNFTSKLFYFYIVAIWSICLIAVLPGIYFSLSSLEFSLLGGNHFFSNRFISAMFDNIRAYFDYFFAKFGLILKGDIIARVMIGLYGVPIFIFFIVSFIKKNWEFLTERRLPAANEPILARLEQRVSKICSMAGAGIPRVVLKNSSLAWSRVENSLFRGNVLVISNTLLKILDDQELDSILAHEVWHLKRHIFSYNLLSLLSEWTLFGRGFFAVALNTKQLEFEADDFALEWLETNGIDSKIFVKSLNKILIANSMSKYISTTMDDTVVEDNNKEFSFGEKIKLLYDFYLGDLVFSYVHPTMEERIIRIEGR